MYREEITHIERAIVEWLRDADAISVDTDGLRVWVNGDWQREVSFSDYGDRIHVFTTVQTSQWLNPADPRLKEQVLTAAGLAAKIPQ